MKKTVVVLTSMLAILLSACSQIPGLNFGSTPTAGPVVDTSGTSVFQTAVAQTLTAQPQPTLPIVSATDTPVVLTEPFATDSALATSTPIETFTFTPTSNLTTPATATNVTTNATVTVTLAPGQVTASPTLGIRTYGTLPPKVPFSRIKLINKAKAEAYISLQVNMPDGKFSIIEYPVPGSVEIKAPLGYYTYVAWVGGKKMVGNFKLTHGDDLTITLFKKKVTVK